MKFKILGFVFLFGFSCLQSLAQLMDGQPAVFTQKDSLRGTLSNFRNCYDVTYYHLAVKINIEAKTIQGSNSISFKCLTDFEEFQIDLFDNLNIDQILFQGKALTFKRVYNAVFVKFPNTLLKGQQEKITVFYSGTPTIAKKAPWDGGIVFSKDENGEPWVAVACQGFGASCWWPNKDHQSDEPDSMLISITCPDPLLNISNGRLRSVVKQNDGYSQYNWFVANPINNYDVTFNIGNYVHFTDTYVSPIKNQNLTLDYWVMKNNEVKAKKQFEQVKPMLAIFENRFGPYAFYEDGYKLVESPYLGMEHQSCVAYGNGYKNGYRGFDLSGSGEGKKFDYIIIHESAHEWWGNSLTSYDIADMWIHEGFGQYAEAVYLEDLLGKSSADKYLNGLKRGVGNKETIIGPYGVNQEGAGDMYPKGALFLNTLRSIIHNDTIWWDIMKGLQEKYARKNISTQDVLAFMNEKSKMDLTAIFHQYLNVASLAKLNVQAKTSESGLNLGYSWDCETKNFDMPITLFIKGEAVIIQPKATEQKLFYANTTIKDLVFDETGYYYQLNLK
jgi:aminopeptidase N